MTALALAFHPTHTDATMLASSLGQTHAQTRARAARVLRLGWVGLFVLFMAKPVHAESTLTAGAGDASARLNFSVVIPRILFLGVGTMTTTPARATNATVDTVAFTYTNPALVGTGAAPNTTTNGTVAVSLFGNNGQVTLSVTNPANLLGSAGNTVTIPFTSITAATSAATLPVPAFGGTSVQPTLSGGRITNRTANWTYTYANTVSAPADTYSGQVTYTAAMP
jgi:hypothetical protein